MKTKRGLNAEKVLKALRGMVGLEEVRREVED